MPVDYQEITSFAKNVRIDKLTKFVETGAPMSIGRLLMEPLWEIETIDGDIISTPIRYRRPSIFRDGTVDAFGRFYEDGEEKYVQRMVAKLPSKLKSWLESTIGDGPEASKHCRINVVNVLAEEDLQSMSRWHENDIKFLKEKGISDPTAE